MLSASGLLVVFMIAVWAHLAAAAASDMARARAGAGSDGDPGIFKWVKIGAAVVEILAFVGYLTRAKTGDANPLIFEYFLLQMICALVAHDALARGEWKWSGRIHGAFAGLAIIAALAGRYPVVPWISLGDGGEAGHWVSVVAALVLGLGPVIAYLFMRGARIDGRAPTVKFVKGVMGASADNMAMAPPRYIIAIVILCGIAINGANVIGRYVYLAPIIWAEEIMIYGMVWTVFVGAVLVTWDSRHLRMDLVSMMLPSPWKEILGLIGVVAFLWVCWFVMPVNWEVYSMTYMLEQRSIVAEVPMSIPHFALLLGFTLMFIVMLWVLVGSVLNLLAMWMRSRGSDTGSLDKLLAIHRRITGDTERSEIEDLVAADGEGSSDPTSSP